MQLGSEPDLGGCHVPTPLYLLHPIRNLTDCHRGTTPTPRSLFSNKPTQRLLQTFPMLPPSAATLYGRFGNSHEEVKLSQGLGIDRDASPCPPARRDRGACIYLILIFKTSHPLRPFPDVKSCHRYHWTRLGGTRRRFRAFFFFPSVAENVNSDPNPSCPRLNHFTESHPVSQDVHRSSSSVSGGPLSPPIPRHLPP